MLINVNFLGRAFPSLGIAGAAVLVAGALGGEAVAAPVGAAGHGSGRPFDFVRDATYQLDLRSAGLEIGTQIPGQTYQDVGFSQVRLTHDLAGATGYCESLGGVEWLGGYVEEGVLGLGAAPPDAGSVKGGYQDPVLSRDVKPDLSAGDNLTNREPSLKNPSSGEKVADIPHGGTPLKTSANCASDVQGAAAGNVAGVDGLAEYAGSTVTSEVSKATGVYTATSRAVVGGIMGAGTLDTISSLMQVTSKPNAEPTVTYRLSFIDSHSVTSVNQNGFTISGTNIPAGDLIEQFNGQAKTVATALAAIGPLGFTLLAPEVGVADVPEEGLVGLPYITAPAIQAQGGAHLRDGTPGQQENARFGSVTFTGINGS